MNINEQELSEAVERLREGETVMGVSPDYVESLVDSAWSFEDAAREQLIEAARTHKEQQAGLM